MNHHFVQKSVVLSSVILMSMSVSAFAEDGTLYTPGTYTGTAQGMESDITATVTVEENSIIEVKLDVSGETAGVGAEAGEELENQILTAQGTDIDGVAGATITSQAAIDALDEALSQAAGTDASETDLSMIPGTYVGTGTGHNGPVKAKVKVTENEIVEIIFEEDSETLNVGNVAEAKLADEIVRYQSLGVDAASGATVTSAGAISAISDALEQAGANVSALRKVPFEKEVEEITDMSADVVVAGGGLGGLATAAVAAHEGLQVIVLEKQDVYGGSTNFSAGGAAVANSQILTEEGYDLSMDRIDAYIDSVNEKSTIPFDRDLADDILSHSGEMFDYYVNELGMEYWVLDTTFVHAVFGGDDAGAGVVYNLAKAVTDSGSQIITGANVTEILMEDDVATGVKAQKDGQEFTVKARAVVVSTGGANFGEESEAALAENMPGIENVDIFHMEAVGNTGDGYRWLEQLGAQMSENEPVLKQGTPEPGGQKIRQALPFVFESWYLGLPDAGAQMMFDADGNRFGTEAGADISIVTQGMLANASSSYYILYDGVNTDEELLNTLNNVADDDPKNVVYAKTLEELAGKLGVDAQNLQDSYDKYQEYCDAGNDADFNKDPSLLVKYDGSKGYYAVYLTPSVWGTFGGALTDHTMKVRKADGTVFENLYAAGETSTGQLFGEFYMGGFSHGYYETEGYLIGMELASKLK